MRQQTKTPAARTHKPKAGGGSKIPPWLVTSLQSLLLLLCRKAPSSYSDAGPFPLHPGRLGSVGSGFHPEKKLRLRGVWGCASWHTARLMPKPHCLPRGREAAVWPVCARWACTAWPGPHSRAVAFVWMGEACPCSQHCFSSNRNTRGLCCSPSPACPSHVHTESTDLPLPALPSPLQTLACDSHDLSPHPSCPCSVVQPQQTCYLPAQDFVPPGLRLAPARCLEQSPGA